MFIFILYKKSEEVDNYDAGTCYRDPFSKGESRTSKEKVDEYQAQIQKYSEKGAFKI